MTPSQQDITEARAAIADNDLLTFEELGVRVSRALPAFERILTAVEERPDHWELVEDLRNHTIDSAYHEETYELLTRAASALSAFARIPEPLDPPQPPRDQEDDSGADDMTDFMGRR